MLDIISNMLMGLGMIAGLALIAVVLTVKHLAKTGHLSALVDKFTKPNDTPPQA